MTFFIVRRSGNPVTTIHLQTSANSITCIAIRHGI